MPAPVPAAETVHRTRAEQVAELHRQADVLLVAGYPELLGTTETGLRALVDPLVEHLPADVDVLLVAAAVDPLAAITRTALGSKVGFSTMSADELAAFEPVVEVPAAPLYLVLDPSTGPETLGVRPNDALPLIAAAGRSPLTLAEGLALVTQHPQWLRERNCVELLGSRAGDERVLGLWVSARAPRLGWCWAGNPHTWLGMATAAARVG